jgi:hypothetical protein
MQPTGSEQFGRLDGERRNLLAACSGSLRKNPRTEIRLKISARALITMGALPSSHPAVTTFPDNVVGSACTSSFSRPAQRSLALRPAHSRGHLYVTSYTEGFSHFVTSMTAPVASGWSVRRVGLAPTGKRLLTAHANSGHWFCHVAERRMRSVGVSGIVRNNRSVLARHV